MKVYTAWLIFLGLICVDCRTYYDGFKVYQVTPKSMDQAQVLKQYENNDDFDFWSDLRALNTDVNIMVSPTAQAEFEGVLGMHNINYDILIDDVEQSFEEERKTTRSSTRVTSGEVTFADFMRYDDERLWRKTRTPGTICYGVDPNRNFDYQWRIIGASRWQCDQTYAGHIPFSEPETQVIRDTTLRYKDNIELYLAIHSYGRWLLYPWGHTTDEPDNTEELNELGRLFTEAIYAVNSTEYVVGSTANALYYAAGTSADWAKGGAGIDLSYTIELPGGGTYGFDIPATEIQPVVEETWEGFRALHGYIQNKVINSS